MESVATVVHHEPWNKGKIVGQKAPFKVKEIWALRVRLQMESRVRELALFNLGIDSKLRGCDLVSLKVRDICHGDQVASRAMVMQHKTQRPVQFEITPATRDAVQKWIKLAALKSDAFLFPSRIHNSPHLGTRQYARILEGWVEELGLDPADYGTHSMRRTKHPGVDGCRLRAAVAQHLADLWQRGAALQHAHGQGVTELVRAAVRRIDLGSLQRVAHDRADAVRALQESAYRHHGSQEQVSVLAGGSSTLELESTVRYLGIEVEDALEISEQTEI